MNTNGLSWLKLPRIDKRSFPSLSLMYGADRVVRKYTNRPYTPWGIEGEWQHGWHTVLRQTTPISVGGISLESNPDRCSWVARKDEEELLKGNGYRAKAIGLPICYTKALDWQRRKRSLLIMPAHSSKNIPAAIRNEPSYLGYLDYIEKLKEDFEAIVACVHEECIEKELWVHELRQLDIPVLQGASVYDKNSLSRMRALMSQFEYVSSNVMGSHIAYAAAFGAKVSVAGPEHTLARANLLREPLYSRHPELIDALEKRTKLERACFPFVFVEPLSARQCKEWGMQQIGMDNRISPDEMIKLFKVGCKDECSRRARRVVGRAVGNAYRIIGRERHR